jgi:hypothetical protein
MSIAGKSGRKEGRKICLQLFRGETELFVYSYFSYKKLAQVLPFALVYKMCLNKLFSCNI